MTAKYKIRIRKAICTGIRKTTVLKRKFDNTYNDHFERPTIVYCIVDTIYTVLTGINLVTVYLKQHAN